MSGLIRAVCAAILLAVSASGAAAASAETFAPLIGAWRAEGTSFGKPAKSRMVWRSVLDGKAVQIDYEITLTLAPGEQRFAGAGHFVATDASSYRGYWVDTGPELFPIEGTIGGGAFTSIWGVAGQKRGKTVYRVIGPTQVEVIDWLEQKDGSWREFNRATFTRRE